LRASVAAALFAVAILLSSFSTAYASTSTMVLNANAVSYSGQTSITYSGTITPVPTVASSVVLTTTGPSGTVDIGTASVSTTTGSFSYTLVSGGSSNWVSGTYIVNGTWGANGNTGTARTSFSYTSGGSVTVSFYTAQRIYSGADTIIISGDVSPAPTSGNTAVVLTVENPSGTNVNINPASVAAGTGAFIYSFVAGGTSSWISGNYTIGSTYPQASTASETFYYGASTISGGILTPSGISTATIGGYQGVALTYSSSYYQQLSVFVWMAARNSQGQTVGLFLGSATIGSGGSVAVFVPAFNLPAGTYTASVFATTTGYIAVSATSSLSLTVP
jgi:hypothetical protein